MSTILSFKSLANKHDIYRGKDCMKKFCEFLRKHAMKIINFKKKKMKLLTKEQQESQKSVIFVKVKNLNGKKRLKVRDHCYFIGGYRGSVHSICTLKHSAPKKSPIVFHNGSKFDYHFIIKKLAKEFLKQFTCLGLNTEKYIKFEAPLEIKLQELIKMEKKLQRIYLAYYNLLIVQSL